MDSDILQSTFNELNHLVIPPSELAIEEDVELGVGAYGEVFFATLNRNSTSVKVAVKQLRIAQAKGVRRRIAIRLARELKVWARASHPNILALVGFYVSDNYSCAQLVSPLMSNGNVKNYVEAHQPSLATRLHLITGIASGMNYLHTCDPPICHGDLKPSNVVVNDSIEAVLCDFGLANFVLESGATTGLSTTSVKGCARYMSPELFSNEAAKHILESDIWAWACTAFEIVTDVHPFHLLKTDGAVILALLQGKPPGSSSLLGSLALGAHVSCPMGQDTLESVITGCWGMDPEYRPRSSDIKHRMLGLGCYDRRASSTGPSLSADLPQTALTPNFEHRASITSVDGVPDLTGQIKKDISILKQGGKFCDVYVGYHEGSEPSGPSLVALRLPNKKYDAEVSERRFIREVRLWYSLNHGNINPLLGTFLDHLGIHMVSPWRQRGDVFSLLRTRRMTWTELPKILIGVSSAICYLHGQDCVHGDLKMQNVLLADNGEPFLTNFGLSKRENISIISSTEGEAFSYPWCAPELLMGDSKSTASDMYAFAMMIVETLTWHHPFPNHRNLVSLILAIMEGERPQENEVDQSRAPLYWKALWQLANSCWSQSAAARPNIVHVHEQLAKIFS